MLQATSAKNATGGAILFDDSSESFEESNLMHSMNGFVYCNGPKLMLPRGATVRWVALGFGSETGMHAPIFTGQQVADGGGESVYSAGLMPSSARVVAMNASTAGDWLYYCNILDHVDAGMMARMAVVA